MAVGGSLGEGTWPRAGGRQDYHPSDPPRPQGLGPIPPHTRGAGWGSAQSMEVGRTGREQELEGKQRSQGPPMTTITDM